MKKLNSILLVDDDEPTNYLHRRLITENNLSEQIHISQTGLEAIEYLGTLKGDTYPCPDVIFLDINMPVMNGWQFLENYRNLPEEQKANIIIVMLTTSLNPDDHEKGTALEEVRKFITKPLTLEKFQTLIKDFFVQEK